MTAHYCTSYPCPICHPQIAPVPTYTLTAGGDIGMNVGGRVIAIRPREWHNVCKEAVDLRNQLDAAEAEVERLREALAECANDLEASVNAEYAGTLIYPSQTLKHERDMGPVRRARKLLSVRQQSTGKGEVS